MVEQLAPAQCRELEHGGLPPATGGVKGQECTLAAPLPAPDLQENLQPLGPGDDSAFPLSMRILKAYAAGNILSGLTTLLFLQNDKLEQIVLGKTQSGPGFEMRKLAYQMIMYLCIKRVVNWSCRRYGLWLPTIVGLVLCITSACVLYYA